MKLALSVVQRWHAALRHGRQSRDAVACGAGRRAAKAHGLTILAGVRSDFADADGLVRECAQGRAMGMDGKTLIHHPSQIDVANRTWTPSVEEIASEAPDAAYVGVLQIEGRMVRAPRLMLARRTPALVKRLRACPCPIDLAHVTDAEAGKDSGTGTGAAHAVGIGAPPEGRAPDDVDTSGW